MDVRTKKELAKKAFKSLLLMLVGMIVADIPLKIFSLLGSFFVIASIVLFDMQIYKLKIAEGKSKVGSIIIMVLLNYLYVLWEIITRLIPIILIGRRDLKKYAPATIMDAFRKFHYPLQKKDVDLDALHDSIYSDYEFEKNAAWRFMISHGVFGLCWYSIVFSCYCWYIMGYPIYWFITRKKFDPSDYEDVATADEFDPEVLQNNIPEFYSENKSSDRFNDLKNRAKQAADNAVSAASQAAHVASERIHSEETEQRLSSAKEKLKNGISNAGDAISGFGEKAKQTAGGAVTDLGEKASSLLHERNNGEIVSDDIDMKENSISDDVNSTPIDETTQQLYQEYTNTPAPTLPVTNSHSSNNASISESSYNSGNTTYPSTSPSSSSVNKALITVVAVLVVGVGTLGGILIIKNKDNDDNETNNNSSPSSSASETPTDDIADSETVAAQTESVTEVELTTEIKTDNKKELRSTPISELEDYSQYKEVIESCDMGDSAFLCDINGDNVPELFIKNAEMVTYVYTVYQNKAIEILNSTGTMSRGIGLYENGAISISFGSGMNSGTVYYEYTGGEKAEIIERIDYESGDVSHTVGDKTTKISLDEADKIYNNYVSVTFKSTSFDELGINSKPEVSITNPDSGKMFNLYHFELISGGGISEGWIEDYDNDGIEEIVFSAFGSCSAIDYEDGKTVIKSLNTSSYSASTSLLSREELINTCRKKASEGGFSMNENFLYAENPIGCVITQGGNLNLRSAPSTESSVIVEIPYGTFVNVLSENSEWLNIHLFINGEAYTGYVAREFVKVGYPAM